MVKKSKGLNPELESAIEVLLADVMNDPEASLTDKCKVLDRASMWKSSNRKFLTMSGVVGLLQQMMRKVKL